MAYFIRIETEEDLDFLKTLTTNAVSRLKNAGSDPMEVSRLSDIAPVIYRLHDVVHSAVKEKNYQDLDVPVEEFPQVKKFKKVKKAKPHKYNLCSEHNTYSGQRVTSRDCDGCWEGYKKMNPEKYDVARRDFERKLKKNAK